jgi:hypothetical protein
MNRQNPAGGPDPRAGWPPAEGGVVELALLLPARQAAALERAAHQQGLTVGQVLRRLVRDFLREPAERQAAR